MVQLQSTTAPVRAITAIVAGIALVLLTGGSAQAQQGRPIDQFVPPLPTPASFIADVAKVLTPGGHQAADAKIRTIQSDGLGDIAVAILPSIGDYAPVDIGVAIYREWKVGSVAEVGSAHRNVGALLLIVPKELSPTKRGECWITIGTGAEGILTDAASGTICRDVIIPHLKEKDYDGALEAGIAALEMRLRADEGLAGNLDSTTGVNGIADLPSDSGSGDDSFPFVPVGGGIGGILATIAGTLRFRKWRRDRPRPCPKCGREMGRLEEAADDAALSTGQKIEEKIASIDYDVWRCQCGGELVIPYRKIFTKYSKCRECSNRTAWSTRRTIMPATTSSSGLAEEHWRCKACTADWTKQVTIPRLSSSSSSSGSSGSSGGGSSFGGSGSTSGGGGGGSY